MHCIQINCTVIADYSDQKMKVKKVKLKVRQKCFFTGWSTKQQAQGWCGFPVIGNKESMTVYISKIYAIIPLEVTGQCRN